jgi:stage II sporulation protein D
MRKTALILPLALLAAAAPASAADRLVIRGAGFGHGIGMSQYGAYGYAKHGFTYDQILKHYYSESALAQITPAPAVRVLLRTGSSSATFTGAAKAGTRALQPDKTYSVTKAGTGTLALRSPTGRKLATFTGVLSVSPTATGQPVLLKGAAGYGVRDGRWRGSLELTAGGGGVDVVNAVGLENYVRGVVAGESPAGWPAEALKAQAVAARSYAATTDAGSAADGFTQYADTRSQVYRGVAGETPTTDAAVAATFGTVVTYGGRPVTTYFFSTSGGHTENVENSFVGALPRPWLRGVDDPFDGDSPKHRWGPYTLTMKQVDAKLGSLVKGDFEGIKVLKRGVSPRIVRAQIVGSSGASAITGPQLRTKFKLFDSWISFRLIGATAVDSDPTASDPAGSDPATGGTVPEARAARLLPRRALKGRIVPGRSGAWLRVEQRDSRGKWWTSAWTTLGGGGRYRVSVPSAGTYRVRYGQDAGAAVRVR